MSQAEVLEIMGKPMRTDSIYHQLEFDLGSMSWESLDSIRRSLETEEGKKMTFGHPIDHSSWSDQYVSWYFGPVVVDTSFTFERLGTKAEPLAKTWFRVMKQRAVVFDVKTDRVKERGFVVIEVAQLHAD